MSVVTIEEAAAWCKVTDPANREALQDVLDSAEDAIGDEIGPLVATVVSERVRGGGGFLVLNRLPVVAVMTITGKSGSVTALGDTYVTPEWGMVELNSGSTWSEEFYTVTYTHGHAADAASLPPRIRGYVREQTQHLWKMRGKARNPQQAEASGSYWAAGLMERLLKERNPSPV